MIRVSLACNTGAVFVDPMFLFEGWWYEKNHSSLNALSKKLTTRKLFVCDGFFECGSKNVGTGKTTTDWHDARHMWMEHKRVEQPSVLVGVTANQPVPNTARGTNCVACRFSKKKKTVGKFDLKSVRTARSFKRRLCNCSKARFGIGSCIPEL